MADVILPKIHRVKLSGFQPLFESDVELKLPTGPFLILGGNAMGKTTTVQAAVFAIAGEVDDEIEEERAFRWGARYFRDRLLSSGEPEITVEFSLGDTHISVRRGTDSDTVRGVKVSQGAWINDSAEATVEYERAVAKHGNFTRFSDFRYLIHRLCYLPEHRRSLLWDQRAQLRVVMLICSDAAGEMRFREMRQALQRLDSEKRHLHVDIGHLEKRLTTLKSSERSDEKKTAPRANSNGTVTPNQFDVIDAELKRITARKTEVLAELSTTRSTLTRLNVGLERQQQELTRAEDTFVLNTLRGAEEAVDGLALHKLLVHHRCPYCSQRAAELAAQAKHAISAGNCPVCRQVYLQEALPVDLQSLRISLAAETNEFQRHEANLTKALGELEQLNISELSLRGKLSEIVEKLPRVARPKLPGLDTRSAQSVEKTLRIYRLRHQSLQQRWIELKASLDREFSEFAANAANRLNQLQKVASDYGRAFLGHECEFVPTTATGELSTFTFFVPSFADFDRTEPEQCSESERFFLDIGFRMALLDLAGLYSRTRSTFICETPESALDLAYTANVADMFGKFAARRFSLLLTANIQAGGIAKPLLAAYPPEKRQARVFDLIHTGEPSEVQKDAIAEFEAALGEILNG